MPTSRSRPRGAEPPRPPARPSLLRTLVPIVVVAVLAVTVIALPASLIRRGLPPFIVADDFSGSVWHGSAGSITVQGHPAGALEWRLRPASLLRLTATADLHWVDVGFVVDATAAVDRHGVSAHDVHGGGPIADLSGIGVASGWRGAASFKFDEIRVAFVDAASGGGARLEAAHGLLEVENLSTPGIAGGTDLGGYVLRVADDAELADTGGPLEVHATVHFVAGEHRGTLTGTVRARPGASPALRSQIDSLGQMRAPDSAGRIPVELEFNF